LYSHDSQACQHYRQNVAQQLRTAPAACLDTFVLVDQRPRFVGVSAARNLADRGEQIGHHLLHASVVLAMKSIELVQDVMSLLHRRMLEHLSASDDVKGDAAEAMRHAHVVGAWIVAQRFPACRHGAEVLIAADQIVGDVHDGGAEHVIGAAYEFAAGPIDLIAGSGRGKSRGR
jgi:hypothetical protein